MKQEERSTKIIRALLEVGSFGPVDEVEDIHEQAEEFLDEELAPGWRDDERVPREQYEKMVACLRDITEEITESKTLTKGLRHMGNIARTLLAELEVKE